MQIATPAPAEDFPPDPNVAQPSQEQSLRQHLNQAVGEAARTVSNALANEIVRSITQGATDPMSSGARSPPPAAPDGAEPTYQNSRRPKGERF